MKITLKSDVQNAYGSFTSGAEVDWPENCAKPLVDVEAATEGWKSEKKAAKSGASAE